MHANLICACVPCPITFGATNPTRSPSINITTRSSISEKAFLCNSLFLFPNKKNLLFLTFLILKIVIYPL